MVGVNPLPLTLRQLLVMYIGRTRQLWDHTACLGALMLNTSPNRKGPRVSADKLHPYSGRDIHVEATPMDVDIGWAGMKSLARGKVCRGKFHIQAEV